MGGSWPTWCTGVRVAPFRAHVWGEVDGVPVGAAAHHRGEAGPGAGLGHQEAGLVLGEDAAGGTEFGDNAGEGVGEGVGKGHEGAPRGCSGRSLSRPSVRARHLDCWW
ncbi:lasso peptide biosynthesis protein [Streptomyces specialis]|uniref:lasso peptide biosynthesis protein n=1 Tax=Streptomyces specialis TaxID=498367 RepID=UPI00389A3200